MSNLIDIKVNNTSNLPLINLIAGNGIWPNPDNEPIPTTDKELYNLVFDECSVHLSNVPESFDDLALQNIIINKIDEQNLPVTQLPCLVKWLSWPDKHNGIKISLNDNKYNDFHVLFSLIRLGNNLSLIVQECISMPILPPLSVINQKQLKIPKMTIPGALIFFIVITLVFLLIAIYNYSDNNNSNFIGSLLASIICVVISIIIYAVSKTDYEQKVLEIKKDNKNNYQKQLNESRTKQQIIWGSLRQEIYKRYSLRSFDTDRLRLFKAIIQNILQEVSSDFTDNGAKIICIKEKHGDSDNTGIPL